MTYSILEQPLQQLDFSDSFKEMAYCHNFHTVKEILNFPVTILLMHEGFTYHHYQELRNILKQNNAVNLLKTKPSQFA
jgi:hypothetical protein